MASPAAIATLSIGPAQIITGTWGSAGRVPRRRPGMPREGVPLQRVMPEWRRKTSTMVGRESRRYRDAVQSDAGQADARGADADRGQGAADPGRRRRFHE